MRRLRIVLRITVQDPTLRSHVILTSALLSNKLKLNPSSSLKSTALSRFESFIADDYSVGISDATGFVSLDHTNKLIVVSFRGSRSVRNFIGNLNFVLAPWSICSGCTAHLGFLDSWMSARSVVLEAVTSAKESNPNYQVVSTGHSLGGALATLAAADLRESGHDVELVCCS